MREFNLFALREDKMLDSSKLVVFNPGFNNQDSFFHHFILKYFLHFDLWFLKRNGEVGKIDQGKSLKAQHNKTYLVQWR